MNCSLAPHGLFSDKEVNQDQQLCILILRTCLLAVMMKACPTAGDRGHQISPTIRNKLLASLGLLKVAVLINVPYNRGV